MVLPIPSASWEKLASSLAYLALLLCLSAFSANPGDSSPLSRTSVPSELAWSGHQQLRKTINWQNALAAYNHSLFPSFSLQALFIQLSYLHDRLSKVAYVSLFIQYIAHQTLYGFEQLKTIPQNSDELSLYLSRG